MSNNQKQPAGDGASHQGGGAGSIPAAGKGKKHPGGNGDTGKGSGQNNDGGDARRVVVLAISLLAAVCILVAIVALLRIRYAGHNVMRTEVGTYDSKGRSNSINLQVRYKFWTPNYRTQFSSSFLKNDKKKNPTSMAEQVDSVPERYKVNLASDLGDLFHDLGGNYGKKHGDGLLRCDTNSPIWKVLEEDYALLKTGQDPFKWIIPPPVEELSIKVTGEVSEVETEEMIAFLDDMKVNGFSYWEVFGKGTKGPKAGYFWEVNTSAFPGSLSRKRLLSQYKRIYGREAHIFLETQYQNVGY